MTSNFLPSDILYNRFFKRQLLEFWNIKGTYGSHLTQYLKTEAFLGIIFFLKFHQRKISFPVIYSIIWFWNIKFLGYWSSEVKRGHAARVISRNAQCFRMWDFQHELCTPSPFFHVKIGFVQICFRLASFSGFIYRTTLLSSINKPATVQICLTWKKALILVEFDSINWIVQVNQVV